MAKKLKVGDTLRGYRITKVFGPGAMAISYAAQAPSGEKVFLKQYKSPAPTVVWYGPFVDYQQELAARVRNGKASHYAVRLIDAFEEEWGGPCYFQAIEFVENGSDLQGILDEEHERHRATGRSVLADPRAPWQGYQGYVGSDNYRSPEHMTRGMAPVLASDVFTCGLMLYELLAGVHPYWRDDQAEYAQLVRAHAAKPPVLAGVMPPPATNEEVSRA